MSLFEQIKKTQLPVLIDTFSEKDFVEIAIPMIQPLGLTCKQDLDALVSLVPDKYRKQIDTQLLWAFLMPYL